MTTHDCHCQHCLCCIERRLVTMEGQLTALAVAVATLQTGVTALLAIAQRPVGIDVKHGTPTSS